jgi:hypothetical protein
MLLSKEFAYGSLVRGQIFTFEEAGDTLPWHTSAEL